MTLLQHSDGMLGEVRAPGTAKRSVSTESELAVSSGDAGSSGPLVNDMMRASATAVGKSVGEPRTPGKHSATTGSVFAVSSGEAGSVGPGANDTTSVAATAVAKSVVEARRCGIAKHRATTAVTAVAKSVEVGEARPPRVTRNCPSGTPTQFDQDLKPSWEL